MFQNTVRDPCRIAGSDSEDEEQYKPSRTPISITTRPATPKVIKKPFPPKSLDWTNPAYVQDPTEETPKRSSSGSSGSSKQSNEPVVATTTPESPPASPPTENTSTFDPISLIKRDSVQFINTYIPKEYSAFIQCRLRRDKDGVQGGFFPTFYLHAERPEDQRKFFLLAARKVAKVKRQSEYIITTNVETLSEKAAGNGFVGRLRGNNLAGTEYTLYDNGLSPNKIPHVKNLANKEGLRRELAAVVYNTNILGFKGPRQMSVVVPKLGHEVQPAKDDESLLEQWRHRRFSYLTQLRNRSPRYNEETKMYVLQFTGNRVAQPSVKNFQIVIDNENHEEEVVMQFGRVDADTFTCDYRYPLTALQAFGIGLSSFDSRLARE